MSCRDNRHNSLHWRVCSETFKPAACRRFCGRVSIFYVLDHKSDQGGKMKLVHSAALAVILLLSGSANAADFAGSSSYCRFVEDATELVNYASVRELRAEVRTRYEHAAEVSNSNQAIYSTSPLFVWANQAKISCAKSYGYLRMTRKWRKRPDHVTLQRCECFYQRMSAYLGH